MTINVYERYYAAKGSFHGVERRGALVMLIADSGGGAIRYEAAVSFFPHRDEADYAVTYDAYFSRVVYEAPGHRSKKRENDLLDTLRAEIDALAGANGAAVLWEKPLRSERRG